MKFEIKTTSFFVSQLNNLNSKSKRLIDDKINMIKKNPFRYKKINSKKFNRVFRVRLKINNKETRLVYVVLSPNIIIVCLLDRKKDYIDLEKYLEEI